MHFERIYTPLVTPHKADCSINGKAFGEAIDHLVD
jgi:dihydrodipicolinate synthase/N-acetylneuraminate lyase